MPQFIFVAIVFDKRHLELDGQKIVECSFWNFGAMFFHFYVPFSVFDCTSLVVLLEPMLLDCINGKFGGIFWLTIVGQ